MLNRIAKTLLPLFWMGLIFILSSEPASFFPAVFSDAENALMHIFLYAVLAYLVASAGEQWFGTKRIRRIFFFSIFFGALYGITDEYHQSFVPGRSASLIDLFFDAAGAVLGATIFCFVRKKRKPRLLLHVCCIGCGAYVSKLLKDIAISPHKASGVISEIGKKLEGERGIKFFNFDFKKDDGSRKACALAKEMGLYRQNYCGCEFSRRVPENV